MEVGEGVGVAVSRMGGVIAVVAVGVGNTGVDNTTIVEEVGVVVGEGIGVDVAVAGTEVAVGDADGVDIDMDVAVGDGVGEGSAGVKVEDEVTVGVRVAVAGATTVGRVNVSNRGVTGVEIDSEDWQETAIRTDINVVSNAREPSFIRELRCDR